MSWLPRRVYCGLRDCCFLTLGSLLLFLKDVSIDAIIMESPSQKIRFFRLDHHAIERASVERV